MKETHSKNTIARLPRSVRLVLAAAVIAVCILGILDASRVGLSRLRVYQGKAARAIEQTEMTVGATPNDPEAHSGHALLLLNKGNMSSALSEFERAISLRPRDYFLWLELGRARDMANDQEGALAALEQAARLAPEYAQPRWHFGNVLFRAGRVEEAFPELRRAALSDATLLPNFIDLAWGATERDTQATIELIQPQRTSWRIALAKFFARRGEASAAVAQFRAAGQFSDEDRRALLNDLLANKRFKDAYQVWAMSSAEGKSVDGVSRMHDGGFEQKLSRDDPGFGWQLAREAEAVRLSLDRNSPRAGAQSLRIDFNGESNPNQPIVTQLILVEPGTRYRLRFAARTEKLVSGGMPLLSVSDASSKESRALAQSLPLAQSTEGWQEYDVMFTTSETTEVVLLSLHRQICGEAACPIFGRVWLDDFRIEKA